MPSRYLKSYKTSFQAKVIDSLRELLPRKNVDSFTLNASSQESEIAELFSSALGVSQSVFLASIMEAELLRMVNIKKRRASLEDMNVFYSEAIVVDEQVNKELGGLVANYLPVKITQLKNEQVIKQANSKLGFRYNNYRAYRLANFDGKPTIEIIFYIDNTVSKRYKNAWLGVQGSPLKCLSFCNVNSLCEYVNQVSIFANICDLEYMHIGSRGLRYKR
jgi:hypothetical protein